MVDFHPQEFLLASGSGAPNAMINFWDLESFKSVSSMKLNNQAIRYAIASQRWMNLNK